MSVTYYVALPFIRGEAIIPGQPNEPAAIRLAEMMSRKPEHAGALAFKRTGDPNLGNFGEAIVLRAFGEVPENLDEL